MRSMATELVGDLAGELAEKVLAVRLKPGLPLVFTAARASQPTRNGEQRRVHVEPARLGELAHIGHHRTLAPTAVEP